MRRGGARAWLRLCLSACLPVYLSVYTRGDVLLGDFCNAARWWWHINKTACHILAGACRPAPIVPSTTFLQSIPPSPSLCILFYSSWEAAVCAEVELHCETPRGVSLFVHFLFFVFYQAKDIDERHLNHCLYTKMMIDHHMIIWSKGEYAK